MNLIAPDWPTPGNVRAFSTTRLGGHSHGPWCSMNLGMHCGDDSSAVLSNRQKLLQQVPSAPQWLHQVHGTQLVMHPGISTEELDGDALLSRSPEQVCAVLTADCLPVLFCTITGTCVAIAHAGWRGLAQGVLAETVKAMNEKPTQIMAWLGPAIGPSAYEVGEDVRKAFVNADSECFIAHRDRWFFDLYGAARNKLRQLGVNRVYGGDYCTFRDHERFFSYRRDGVTGRMASLIWLDS